MTHLTVPCGYTVNGFCIIWSTPNIDNVTSTSPK